MDALEIAAAIGTVGMAGGMLYTGVRTMHRVGLYAHEIRTALMGEPERTAAGVRLPAIPGLGERLDRVERQFLPDHGGTLRDVVDRIEQTLAQHCATPAERAHPEV